MRTGDAGNQVTLHIDIEIMIKEKIGGVICSLE